MKTFILFSVLFTHPLFANVVCDDHGYAKLEFNLTAGVYRLHLLHRLYNPELQKELGLENIDELTLQFPQTISVNPDTCTILPADKRLIACGNPEVRLEARTRNGKTVIREHQGLSINLDRSTLTSAFGPVYDNIELNGMLFQSGASVSDPPYASLKATFHQAVCQEETP